jgi:hypothetical protein
VAREAVYSPGRFLAADRAILEATGRALVARGARVEIVEPDAKPAAFDGCELVFAMCQGPAALDGLRQLATRGIPLVHEADAILNCHRVRMLPILEQAGLPRPATRLVDSSAPDAEALAWLDALPAGAWVKRGDVHATQPGDVSHAADAAAARAALERLAAHGVPRAVLEAHVPGRTLKFYAVRGTPLFRLFDESGSEAACASPDWREIADRAAHALGLAVYGGDLVVDDAGTAALVDVNDWPSFTRCRDDAAEAIATHLWSRLGAPRDEVLHPQPS